MEEFSYLSINWVKMSLVLLRSLGVWIGNIVASFNCTLLLLLLPV